MMSQRAVVQYKNGGGQFQIAYAGQFALAVNGEIKYVQLGGDQPFEWLVHKMWNDHSLQRAIQTASRFATMIRVAQMAYLSTKRGAALLNFGGKRRPGS